MTAVFLLPISFSYTFCN